jgi:hypothetical protein
MSTHKLGIWSDADNSGDQEAAHEVHTTISKTIDRSIYVQFPTNE